MPRKSKELSALEVGRLAEPGLHFVGGVAGLAMQVQPSGARSWVLRFTVAGNVGGCESAHKSGCETAF